LKKQISLGERVMRLISWKRIGWVLRRVLLLTILLLTLKWEGIPPNGEGARMNRILLGTRFDFLSWEVNALVGKLNQQLAAPQDYLDEPARKQMVFDYLQSVADIYRLEWEIERLYVDPEVDDPLTASAGLRAELDELRARQAEVQGTAEAILQEQVASVLADEGFDYLGLVIPPVNFHFTPLPMFLIISPRDRIELSKGVMLRGDLPLERIEEIEDRIAQEFDVSALIEPIGGLAVYPSMMQESSSISWVIGTVAHEWTHHYYFFWLKPVGLYYEARPEARTINETAADIAGEAVRERVVERYYPELVPPPTPTPDPLAPPPPTPEPPAFDFIAEMRETRVTVDRLLEQGEIEKAEQYMELRRRYFVENGYAIRKLNQAYFAFHGAYAADPGGGAAGANPVGNPVQDLWAVSPSLKAFIETLGSVTSREEVLEALEEMEQKYGSVATD
jgi:hypothetical protein